MNRTGKFFAFFPPPQNALAWVTAAALLFFAIAGLLFIDSQTIHEDEGRRGIHAIEFLAQLHHPAAAPWLLMEASYIGTLNSVLFMPAIALLGPTPAALRLSHFFLALASMGLMFLVLRRLFRTPTALLTVCLLAVNSTWIRTVRVGGYREEPLQIFFFWLVLALLVIPRRPRWTMAALAAGLALWGKLMFLGYLAGMVLGVTVFGPLWKDTGASPGRNNWRTISPAAALAFIAGLSPLLYWNYQNGWETFRMMSQALFRTQGDVPLCDNAHLAANLLERLFNLVQLLSSQIGIQDLDGVKDPGFNAAYLFLTAFCAAGTGVFIFSRAASRTDRTRFGFLAVLYATVFLCSCYAPVARYAGHLAILFPFPEFVVAFFFCRVLSTPGTAPWVRVLVAAWMTAHAGIEAVIMTRVLNRIHHGRYTDFRRSPAMFSIAQTLRDAQARSLITFCKAMGLNIGYLCGDRVETHDMPYPSCLPGLLSLPHPVFILTMDGQTTTIDGTPAKIDMNAQFALWRNAARPAGLAAEPCRVFVSPQTGHIFRLYRVSGAQPAAPRAGSAENGLPPPGPRAS